MNYELHGKQCLIKYPSGALVATIGDDGCLDGGDQMGLYGKLCKRWERPAPQTVGSEGTAPDRADLASMKSDLRRLVTAEEAYFADSVKYTTRLPDHYMFGVTTGNVLGPITVAEDGQG